MTDSREVVWIEIQPGAMSEDRHGNPRLGLVIPGCPDAKPGDVIGLTAEDLEALSVDNWARVGAVKLVAKPRPKPKAKPVERELADE